MTGAHDQTTSDYYSLYFVDQSSSFVKICVGETFLTRKVIRSVAQIHLENMEEVSTESVALMHGYRVVNVGNSICSY